MAWEYPKHKYNQELACRITDVFPGFKVLEAGGPGELHITEKIVIWIEEGVVKYIWDEIGQQWVNLEDQRR